MPRMTTPTVSVLRILLAATESQPVWGLKICDDCDLGPGTVYPILKRLSAVGWTRDWDEVEPHPGRPARRYHALNREGRILAEDSLALRERRRRAAGVR